MPLCNQIAATRRVICIDILGMGDSVAPPEALGAVGLDWFAGALLRFLSGIGVAEFDLFGSSLGGGVCIEIAR